MPIIGIGRRSSTRTASRKVPSPPVADQDTYLVADLAGTAVKLFGSEKPSGKFRHLSGKFAVDLKGKAMPGKRTEQSVKFTGPVRSLGTAVEGNFHTAAD